MKLRMTPAIVLLSAFLLAACGAGASKKSNVLDIYDMPRASDGSIVYTPVDNDRYYTRPGGYMGCRQIGDSPSCGGG